MSISDKPRLKLVIAGTLSATIGTGLFIVTTVAAPVGATPPQDWSQVPAHDITLFYPGQSSYEWLLSKEHKRANRKVAAGDSCVACHEGEEEDLGKLVVAGERLEPTPVAGKQPTIKLALQIAYDEDNAYFRTRWRTRNPYPGEAHPFKRYNGSEWEHYGYPKLDAVVQSGEQPGIYEDRFSMMIDDGSVPNFATQGCWLSCHDGQRDMPGKASPAEVKANPILGDQGLRKKDVRKYLPASRTDANWASTRSREELDRIKAQGGFVDLMQWRGHRANPVGMADDFYVLEYRLMDAGKGPFSVNWDTANKQPKYMYDASKYGAYATRIERIRTKPTALVREQNALPFDATLPWEKGDLIPAYVTSRKDTKGSAADNSDATGAWKDGMWTVVWTRPLNLDNPDDKPLRPGGHYTFTFAVHDDNITTRGHHVSWPVSVGFGVDADIVAVKLP